MSSDVIAKWADLVVDALNAVTRCAPDVFRLGPPALIPAGEAGAIAAQAA
jgi:hypothetical protein